MGNMSKPEGEVLAILEAMVMEHPLSVSTEEFKSLLSWVWVEFPDVDSETILTPSLWEKINWRVYEKTTLRDEVAAELVTASAVTFEVIATKWDYETQAGDTVGPEKQRGRFYSDEECLLPRAERSIMAFLRSSSGVFKPVESPEKHLYRDEEAILTREQNLQKGILELSQESPSPFGAVPAAGLLLQAGEGAETSSAACESLSGPGGVEETAMSPLGGYRRDQPDPEQSTGTAAPAPRLPGVGFEPQLSVKVTSAVTQTQPQLYTPPASPPPGQPSSGAFPAAAAAPPSSSGGGAARSLRAQPGAGARAGGGAEPRPAPSAAALSPWQQTLKGAAAAALLKLNPLCNTGEQQQLENTTASSQQIDSLDTTQSQESFEHSRANAQFFQPANPPTDMNTGLQDMSIQSPTSLEWFQKNSRKVKIKSIIRFITG